MSFREDILRGVRLFLITFAVILLGVWIYQLLRVSADAQVSPPTPPAAEAAPDTPAPSSAPTAEASAESRGLIVPPPPPVPGATPGATAARVVRSRNTVPPPPPPLASPVAKTNRAPRPAAAREFETGAVGALPPSVATEIPDSSPEPRKQGVGYKSLIEANANHPTAEPAAAPPPVEAPAEHPQRGNRFFRAVGKIFRSNGKKETLPLTLQPKQP